MYYLRVKALALVLLTCPSLLADVKACQDAMRTEDYAEALKQCSPLAKQGDAIAQFTIGFMYRNGKGVPQDYTETTRW